MSKSAAAQDKDAGLMDKIYAASRPSSDNESTGSSDDLHNPDRGIPVNRKVSLSDLNWSGMPTKQDLDELIASGARVRLRDFKRPAEQRMFVNQDLRLDYIKFFGFDMDYTIAQYRTVEFEGLAYGLIVEQLLKQGFPNELGNLKYDPSFPIRGLFLDKQLGNLLKVSSFGRILRAVHGKRRLSRQAVRDAYPSMLVHPDEVGTRFYVLDTLFAMPEACLYADLVEHFESRSECGPDEDSFEISYSSLFQDLRSTIDFVHSTSTGKLKKETLANIDAYIHKDPKLAPYLERLRTRGKVFLLTNSEFEYTRAVMSYLLDDLQPGKCWRDYFDIVIVSARKPRFFGAGSQLREIHPDGTLSIRRVKELKPGVVYTGGNMERFQQLTGAQPQQVLYFGDHIFGDIIMSKKMHGWRTMLMVPELNHELAVFRSQFDNYVALSNLLAIKDEIYRGLDSESVAAPSIEHLRDRIRAIRDTIDSAYNQYFGSLFRSGNKVTWFSMQVERYADIYSSTFFNLQNYPLFYQFLARERRLPHEMELHWESKDDATAASPSSPLRC